MSRRHKLSSEASRRFERGVDPHLPLQASARAAALLIEHGGGKHCGVAIAGAPAQATAVTISADLASRVAGMEISRDSTVEHLTSVGCAVEVADDDLVITPPSWRPDLTDPADFTEEVIRLVGYDKIPSQLPAAPAGMGWTAGQRLRRRVGLLLAGSGFTEAPNYPFMGEPDLAALQIPNSDSRRNLVRLANPLSDEQPFLRTTLLPGLLSTALRNLGRGTTDLALFEHGTVFLATPSPEPIRPHVVDRPADHELDALDALLPDQPDHLAVVLTGDRASAGWWGAAQPAGWADAIAAVRSVADGLGVALAVSAGADPIFHPGRCARFELKGNVIGYAGELHPRVLGTLGLPPRTAAAEVDLGALIDAAADVVPAPSVGTMPLAKEDVAVVVDRQVPASAVADALREGAGSLLESLRLFDEYHGEQLPEGKKSLAFSLRFRAPDRTLTAEEVAEARRSALGQAQVRLGAVLR